MTKRSGRLHEYEAAGPKSATFRLGATSIFGPTGVYGLAAAWAMTNSRVLVIIGADAMGNKFDIVDMVDG